LSAELTKTHSFRLFGDFAHWARPAGVPRVNEGSKKS